jgi:hypothetical protein
MLIPKETRPNSKIIEKANRGIFIGYESDNNFLVYLLFNNKILSTKNLIIKEDLNYKEDYLKEISNKDYSSLLEYSNENFNNKTNQPEATNLEGQEDSHKDSEEEPMTEENTIIVEVPRSHPGVLGGYPSENTREDPKSAESGNNHARLATRSLTKDQRVEDARAKEPETRSRVMLVLSDYINDFNINPYALAAIVYITISEDTKAEIEPISIPKSRAKNLVEPKSYKKTMSSEFKDYWSKSKSNELKTLENNNT